MGHLGGLPLASTGFVGGREAYFRLSAEKPGRGLTLPG